MPEDDHNVWIPTYGVGTYGGLDDRHKRRKRKQPAGFAPPQPAAKAKGKRKA